MIKKIKLFCKAQPVLVIAFIAAVITMFIVPPDGEYAGYCNRTVLIQLFSLMFAVAGLRSTGIFEKLTDIILKKAGNIRKLCLMFIIICFFSSMLVTNDVALITFAPLTILTFEHIKDEKSRIVTIVLETAAANLGSMLTPVGNPQNLYLYDTYRLTAYEFVRTMLPAGVLGIILLILFTFILPKTSCRTHEGSISEINIKNTAVYAVLFAVCLMTVFRFIPDYICLIAAVMVGLVCDRKLLVKVDYALLFTFVCFFVFVGNIARIEAVSTFFSGVLSGREVLVSALLSQIISNVPAAVMLSGFTDEGTRLLLGVNIGGLGTIIASLASLISYQFYRKSENAQSGRYMLMFSAINFSMFAIMLVFGIVMQKTV